MDCASRRGGAVAAWEDRGFSSRFTPAPGSLGGSPIAVARVIYLHFLDSAPPLLGRGSTHGKDLQEEDGPFSVLNLDVDIRGQ